jgi:histone H2A
MEDQNNKVVKKKKSHMFETYISKVLKEIAPTNGITNNAKQQLNSALCHIAKHISSITLKLTVTGRKKTVSKREIENALKVVLSGKLLENAMKEGNKSCDKILNAGDSNVNSSRQSKAGIIFPPALTEKFLRNFGLSNVMLSSTSPIYLASVLEYIAYEILDLSIHSCKENKHIRITIRDLEISVRSDVELNDLFTKMNLSFIGGGVLPYIHSSLLKKVKKKKNNNVTKENQHRFRYGTLAIKNIKKQQKVSNNLVLSKSPFEKLVRNIFKKNNVENQKISKDVFVVLQYFIEQYTVKLLKNCNFLAIHNSRVKLIPSDILLFNSFINGGKGNPYLEANLNLFSLSENNENMNLMFESEQQQGDNRIPEEDDDEEGNGGDVDDEIEEEEN